MDSLQIICLVVVLVLGAVLLISRLNLRNTLLENYKISNSSEEAYKKMGNWWGSKGWGSTVWFFLKFFVSFFSACFIVSFLFQFIGRNILIVLVLIALTAIFLIFVETIDTVAMKKILITIKKEKDLYLAEIVIGFVKEYSIFFLFLALIQVVVLSFGMRCELNHIYNFMNSILRTIALVLLNLSLNIIMPLIITFFSKATKIKDDEIETFIARNIPEKIRIKCRVYLIQEGDASAIVTDLLFARIFISKKLLEICSTDEVKAILLHEIAHFNLKHLIKQLSVNLLIFTLVSLFTGLLTSGLIHIYVLRFFGDDFMAIFSGISLVLNLIAFLFFFYDIILGRQDRIRKHEKEADEFVVANGIKPQVFISALQKVYSGNDQPSTLGKLEEKFSTHPSLENRIKYINEFSESMLHNPVKPANVSGG